MTIRASICRSRYPSIAAFWQVRRCPGRGSNPHARCRAEGFKPSASASSATRAPGQRRSERRTPGTVHPPASASWSRASAWVVVVVVVFWRGLLVDVVVVGSCSTTVVLVVAVVVVAAGSTRTSTVAGGRSEGRRVGKEGGRQW